MNLHDYQQECLDELTAYFDKAATLGAKEAFQAMVGRPYSVARGLPEDLPYVCIKVPTGGGKTLIAAHAIDCAASAHMDSAAPTVLWLAPTGAIVEQTLKALEDSFSGGLNPMPLDDAQHLSPEELNEGATVIVATIQSLRRESPDFLKIYGGSGWLMEHFKELDEETLAGLEEEDGRVLKSLANVLRMRRPMVIVDEAHNARTKLSFESLARFNPSCIVELTATPQTRTARGNTASNVLYQVSAARLKQANMIKAPLDMRVNSDPAVVIADAVAKQRELEAVARAEEKDTGEYIRPIVLFQAGSTGSEMDVDRLRAILLEMDGITEEQVAVSIGGRNELEGVDVMGRVPVRFIITMRKLGEGWDCPFAYVLCSVANIGATRAVEQILGRVLRLPRARKKNHPELNKAYAFAAHSNFYEAAQFVRKALVEGAGFNPLEAKDFAPDPEERKTPGIFGGDDFSVAAAKKKPLKIPRLGIWEDGRLELLSQSDFLEAEWGLANLDARLPRFDTKTREGRALIDIGEDEKVALTMFAGKLRRDTALFNEDMACEMPDLVRFVDRWFKHPDVPFSQSAAFIRKAISLLLEKRNMTLAELSHHRFRLARAVKNRVEEHRREMRRRGLQGILEGMGPARRLETSPELALEMRERDYAPNWHCGNSDIFKCHVFPGRVGELRDTGEEFECAFYLDRELPETDVWLRNLERRPATSFWIPTSTDLFYPDFIVRLKDGRILAVEYKGGYEDGERWTTDDSKEKRDLGALWAERSGGRCVFVMANKQRGWEEIDDAIKGGKRNGGE